MDWHHWILLLLQVSALILGKDTVAFAELREKKIAFREHSKCTYSYEIAVHAARGSKTTESDGYHLHALVDITSVASEHDGKAYVYLYRLDVREPRLRRVLFGRITSYPVIGQFENQLSKPFYFRQKEHGTVVDVLFPKATESPQVAAFKKGIAGSFQVNLQGAHKSKNYEVQELDDSGVYRTKYNVVSVNETHAHLLRTWTNRDYLKFADGSPVRGEHKVQSRHSGHLHLKDGNIEQIHRVTKAFLRPPNGHPRAENFKDFEKQDIEISTSGYSKLKLISCSDPKHQRSKRCINAKHHSDTVKSLTRDIILISDLEKINWSELGGEGKKARPLHDVLRCFVDKTVKEQEVGYCSRELHHMVRSDERAYRAIERLVLNRNHQNVTSFGVYVSALAAHGKYEAQNVLAHALKTQNPRPLSDEEYETLLLSIHYLPRGPLHASLFGALSDLAFADERKDHITATAMLVLAGLTDRATAAGYNETLSDGVADIIYSRYKNKSSLYHPESLDHEMHLRDHIWAFGNLGHHSGLPVILEHINHDDSSIRAAVISAMRKMPQEYTNQHLMRALHQDEENDVKEAVVSVFIDRHQNLSDSVMEGLEQAMWFTNKGEKLDSVIQEFLENHGNHSRAVHLRKRHSLIHRRKRALFPALRPREFRLGRAKNWHMGVGGDWLGAETAVQFANELTLRIGIFGGKFELNLDNFGIVRAHILKFGFEIAKGKAAFKASASFKNDFPKDLIHTIADLGDELLRQFDSIASVVTKQIEGFRSKLAGFIPLQIDKFTDFVKVINQFFQNLEIPMQAIKGANKVIRFAKDVNVRVKRWKSVTERISKIQQNLLKSIGFKALFQKALDDLNRILEAVEGLSQYLPKNLPSNFSIRKLLHSLKTVPPSEQATKIKEYFLTLGSPVPKGFSVKFPFKFSADFPSSLVKFHQVLSRLQRFSNSFLDISSLLDSLKGAKLPVLRLPFLKSRSLESPDEGFNFGLSFNWRVSLKFDLQLKSPDYQNFLAVIESVGNFLRQFTLINFNLETFFQEIMPGGTFDVKFRFPELYRGSQGKNENQTNPSDFLQAFLSKLMTLLDLRSSNVSDISDITDFFQELGTTVMQFAEQSLQKTCQIHETALENVQELKDFGEKIDEQGVIVLIEIDNRTRKVLDELLDFTALVDTFIGDIELNLTRTTKRFASDTLQGLTGKMRNIQDLAHDILNFTNGTSMKFSGVCSNVADFASDVIDKVQLNARQALNDLASFIGPVATQIKTIAGNLKASVTEVETWYEENVADRVGKISRVAQFISDFLSLLNTKRGFLNTVREIASRLNEVLKHLRNLPSYANKVKKTIDEITKFASRAQSYKDEIQKLDIRKQFGIDYDQRVRSVCNVFQATTAETLNNLRSVDLVQEISSFFNTEANSFIDKAASKFKSIKFSVTEIQGKVQEIGFIATEVIGILADLRLFSKNFSPVLTTASKLPNCQDMRKMLVDSTKPCVHKALVIGKSLIDQYKELKHEIEVLYGMVPETWRTLKIQNCIRGGICISKAFTEQGKVVKHKLDAIKDKLREAGEYSGLLKTCENGVNNMTAVLDGVKLLIEQVQNFSVTENVERVKTMLQKITGRIPTGSQNGREKRSLKDAIVRIERISDYSQKVKEMEAEIEEFQVNIFRALRSVYDDAVLKHVQTLKDARSKLEKLYQLWQKAKNADIPLKAFDTGIKSALAFADKLEGVATLFANPTLELLANAEELTDVVQPHLDRYNSEVTEVAAKVNGFMNKISDFLSKIQTRQRGLDPSAYKPWQSIPYCSEDICLRSIRRSSSLYLSTIFTWKFPHLDDLSSMQKSGHWLTPGLFDDYKVEGIAQLSNTEMILGMHGVASNQDKASLLVVTNFDKGIKKIIQLTQQGRPLCAKIGGVAIARNYIWISSNQKNYILSIKKSSITATFSSPKPSRVEISEVVNVEETATSVSYDEQTNILWVTSGKIGKAYGYKMSVSGNLASAGLAPDRVIRIGGNAQGMAIVRQFGAEYACISKCALIAGFQCKLEFHDLSRGDETGEHTLARVVRTPSGLESVTKVDNEVIAVSFSSGTFAEKENVELVGGDYEDRYFKLRLPILKTTFGIQENCLYFRVLGYYILRPRPIFPIGDVICGSKRKRSISNELLETDVYYEKLEEIRQKGKRSRRNVADPGTCTSLMKGTLFRGSQTFFEVSTIIPVFGIPVRLFAGVSGHYSVGYQISICIKSKVFKLGLIPGAWLNAYAGASLALFVVEAGVTIEARVLETYLIPELRVGFDRWPLQACIQLKQLLTPLSIRVYLWYRFIRIKVDVWFIGIEIQISWGPKKTFKEWRWTGKQTDRILFTNCNKKVDTTPPIAGSCTARQVADKIYFIQWHGFSENTKITAYHVRIGSIEGSGDDYSTWTDTSLSLTVKDLEIMHGRNVFVSVMAANGAGLDSSLVYCPVFQAKRKGPRIRFVYDGTAEGTDVDYQHDAFSLGMNFAFKSDVSEIASLKWGISSLSSCTYNESESNVVPLMSIGDSNAIQVSGLNLEHGKEYFTRLHALNIFGLEAVMCSDGIVIDTTPPLPITFHDGAANSDVQFLPSVRRVRGKFAPFDDPESPIVKYEWKIVKNVTGDNVTPFVSIPLTQQTPLMEGLSLEAGSSYRLVLRGTNAAGLQAVIETNGFIPDNTSAYCEGNVEDVTYVTETTDRDFVKELDSIQAKWKCFDNESGIRSQLLGVGSYPGGDDIKAFEELKFLFHTIMENGIHYVRFLNTSPLPRIRYHVTIKIINGAGLKKTISSDGIMIDTTPPIVAPEYIKDGEGLKDKNFSKVRFSFSAHWEQAFSDAESGIAEYHVGLGTKPGLADIRAFNTVGSQTSATLTGLLLESGFRYYITVIGCNRVGMCINASSNGANIDFVPPHSGKVITGFTGPPVLFQWISKSVWARWNWCLADEKRVSRVLNTSQCTNDSFYDVHSGISIFGISVISQNSGQPLAPYKLAGRQRFSGRNINLQDGAYSVAIEARDKAGVRSVGLSNTFVVDTTPPSVILVQHGHYGEIIEYVNTLIITFRSFFIVEDHLSLITAYKVGVGSHSGADDVIKFQTVVLPHPKPSLQANWTSLNSTSLKNNRRYFITVLVRNSANLFTIKSSRPLVSDFEAPKSGFVMDGWGLNDAEYQSFSSFYRAHWYGFTDFSGIEAVYLGLSSKPNSSTCDVREQELVSVNTDFHVLSGLALASGSRYYACLKLRDKAGNTELIHSNGVVVDTSAPLPGYVTDGRPNQEIDFQIESANLRASWGNFTERETRIVSYQLAFGSFQGGHDIQEFTDVGLVNTAMSSRLKVPELAPGQRYYASVIALNVLGMPSAVVSSRGVLVDFTSPRFSQLVRDGSDPSNELSYTSESSLKATWICKDDESNISSVQIAFGLQPGEADVLNFTKLLVTQTSFAVHLHLQLGNRYFCTVRCTNKVGLTASSFSSGIVYDDTPPYPLYIKDGNYQDSNRTLVISFKFVDTESGVQRYRLEIWGDDSADLSGSFTFAGNVTGITVQLSKDLISGKTYYVNVTAVNRVGLEATKQSDGFVVDTTPPMCSQVWDGRGSYHDDQEYAQSSSRFVISWICYDSESPIVRFRFSVKDVNTTEYTIPFYSLKTTFNSSGSTIITGGGRVSAKLVEGHKYTSGIEITNAVGMRNVYWTNGVTIDSTPPVASNLKIRFYPENDSLKAEWLVSDKESGIKSISWGLGSTPETNDIKNYSDASPFSRNVTISSATFQQGLTCFFNLLIVNNGGLLGKSSSQPIVVDRSAPIPGVVAAYHAFPLNYDRNMNEVPNSTVVVTWTGFTDPESGVEETSWAIGTDRQKLQQGAPALYTIMLPEESVGGAVIRNLTLVGNETYFVCMRVTNGAGLQRTDCSQGMLIMLGQFSAGMASDGPIASDDIDFQLDDKAIWAHWSGFKDPVFGISRYDWCIRDQPPNPSGLHLCKWPFIEISHLKTRASRFHNLTLLHGTKYYVTVKAENTRGDTVMSSSDGVLIDRTPPIGKSTQIAPSSGKQTVFLTSPSAPVVTWSIEDPESGISHFLVGVGSFPFQDDLLAGQRVGRLSRSLDLDVANFTLYEGLSFYVTVAGVNMLGLQVTLVSQQVVVDWTPPEFGKIVDGNLTKPRMQGFIDSDYQRHKGMLFAQWSEIQDSESDIVEYCWCIGTTQGTCEVKEMTNAGLHTSAWLSIASQDGSQYFFTVEATNGAGLKQIFSSDGVTIDTSPPVISEVYHGLKTEGKERAQVTSQSVGDQLSFCWDEPYDRESGLLSVKWCAGTSNNSCDITSLRSVNPEELCVNYAMSKSLSSGTIVFITLSVTNGAGLTSEVVSPPLVIDTTPPSPGNVSVGNSAETKYIKSSDLIKAEWRGFADNESGLWHFQWAICEACVKDKCISPYASIGLKTTVSIDALGLSYGVSYIVIVRAFNKVGLFSQVSSNQFILDGAGPSPGNVYDGLQLRMDIGIQKSSRQISANWSPFTDKHGKLAEYMMCVGTGPGACDVSDFVSFGIKLKGTISALNLTHNGKYFVTVRAMSESGYSTTATSNGVRVDSTPPVRGKVRDGQTPIDIDYQADDTFIYANWDDFHDEESDVTKYTWCAGTRVGVCDVVQENSVVDRTSIEQQVEKELPEGIKIFITVTAFNNAGTSTTSASDGFKVDSTAPILSKVADTQLGLGDSDIDYLTAKEDYCVCWDAMDAESGILNSEISICSELNRNDCLLRSLEVGNQSCICITDIEFKEGVRYVAMVRTKNNVGLSTELLSDGFVVDTTPPLMGDIEYIDSPKKNDETEAFTHSQIAVQWNGFWDKESGIRTCYVCAGSQPGKCNVKNVTDVKNSTSYTFQGLPLVQGDTYFVSVLCENKAGLRSDLMASDGIIVDKSGPINGGLILDGNKEDEDIDVQKSRTEISAHWNTFDDLESDVIKVTWCAGLSSDICDLVNETTVEPNTTFAHAVLAQPIANGQRYYVTVTATNSAGVTTSLTSDGVTVDDTHPISGIVVDGNESDKDYLYGEDDIRARWFGFVDLESAIQFYEVALCDARNMSLCPQPFIGVGKATNVTLTGFDLESGAQYKFIVRAVNYAGLKIEASSNGFTVDFSPPVIRNAWIGTHSQKVLYQSDSTNIVISWIPFIDLESGIVAYDVCLSSVVQNCTVTTFMDVGLNNNYTIDGLQLTHGKTYYAVVRAKNGIGMSSETTTDAVLIDLTPPTLKDTEDLPHSSRRPPSSNLTSSDLHPQANNLTSATPNESVSRILFRCSEEHLMSRWDEFEDVESGIVRYEWCAGTAETLCNVVALRSVGMKTKSSAIVSRLRSGVKLFATVYIVNGANIRKQLISDPCKVITVAPKLSNVFDIAGLNASNSTDIDWKASIQSLSLSWKVIGKHVDDVSSLRVQVAVAILSSNLSIPRLIEEKSWNGEPLEQPFMDVLSQEQNATIQSVPFQSWNRYRGIVRVWNDGGIYSEASSDGVRLEPSPPPKRGLKIRDKAAEEEYLRWWPNLRVPPVTKRSVDPDITFISNPANVEFMITDDESNETSNTTDYIFDHHLFSPTAVFEIVVNRATVSLNNTNTTLQSRIMKVRSGFSDVEGPCCARKAAIPQSVLSDAHLKPVLPTEDFGVSVAVLSNEKIAIGCKDKVIIESMKSPSGTQSLTLEDFSDANTRVKIASHQNKTGFLLNGKVHLFKYSDGSNLLKKFLEIGKCKIISRPDCSENETWADDVGQVFAVHDHTIAITGIKSNNSVVAVFRKKAVAWSYAGTLGQEKKDRRFGQSVALNKHMLAIVAGEGKNCCVSLYSLQALVLRTTICLADLWNHTAPMSIYLTETDALVLLSSASRLLKVFQINSTSYSHRMVCEYRAWGYREELSGNLDVNIREEGLVAALGIQTGDGNEGVRLIGFQGSYTENSHQNRGTTECANLGTVLARDSGLRVDGMGPRTSVSFRGNTLLFGLPGVLTWPTNDQRLSTGRVFIATYCPLDHFRSRASGLDRARTITCLPCKEGRKSFGGFTETCSVCAGRICPFVNDSATVTSDICDDESCNFTSIVRNSTNGVNLQIMNPTFFIPGSENVYTLELRETTRAGQSTGSLSESFVIDPTAPEVGVVYDGLGTDQNLNCSDNTTFGENSQCSTRNFEDTDVNFTSNTREVHARWIDFLDNESDVVEYFWCVGTQPMRDNIRLCESTGMRPNGSGYGLNLQHGDSYYITVIACNGARMCAAAHSDGVTIDTTPPVMKYVRDGVMGADMDYQVFLDIIFAFFSANDPDSGVTSYEVAWGTGPDLVDISDFEEVINITVWRAQLKDRALEAGKKYYATVRATNGAGLQSDRLSSNGIIVGKSEYVFDNSTAASFFFDTVNVNDDGTRKDGGVGQTYGTLSVPEGAVNEEVKLRCYSLDEKTLSTNVTEEGPVSNPTNTKPKQFMLGNYSFQIKALDPVNDTVKEGFKFAKPIKLSMFYDVGNLVKANEKHVNNELTKEDVDPILFLWDPGNETWFDAALTCPEPWSYVNRSIKLLEVNVCHLTQFAFFWSFVAKHGLILLDKNHSIYDSDGNIRVKRSEEVTELEMPVRRSKGSQGDIAVQWLLTYNDSLDSTDLVWPLAGNVSMTDGQWNASIIINVANNRKEVPESVIWLQLEGVIGGALLASRNETITKIIIASTTRNKQEEVKENRTGWRIIVVTVCVATATVLLVVSCFVYKHRKKKTSEIDPAIPYQATEMSLHECNGGPGLLNPGMKEDSDQEMETAVSSFELEDVLATTNPFHPSTNDLQGVGIISEALSTTLYDTADTVKGKSTEEPGDGDPNMRNPGSLDKSEDEVEQMIPLYESRPGDLSMRNLRSLDNSNHEVETAIISLKPEGPIAIVNPLYEPRPDPIRNKWLDNV